MFLRIQGYRAAATPEAARRPPEAAWEARRALAGNMLLLDSLQMFSELDLTPHEMSRLSGLALEEIKDGLDRLKKAG